MWLVCSARQTWRYLPQSGRTSGGEQSEVQPVRERQELRGTQRDASMGFCSAVTLAFATIFSLVAAALLAIAFSTDNWVTIKVDREELKTQLLQVISNLQCFPTPRLSPGLNSQAIRKSL